MYVGVPIGPLSFLDTYLQQVIVELSMEFDFPSSAHLCYCCNKKMLHLKRAIGPHYGPRILLYSQHLIDTTYAQYFDINFAANVYLAAILSNEHALSHDNLIS